MTDEKAGKTPITDAERYNYLQNIPAKDAQAFFWNYSSRKQRSKAIDSALLAARKAKS